MGTGDTFHFYNYASDDTTIYIVKLSDAVATEGGFGAQVSPSSGKVWPFGAKNLRHVYGVSSTGKRAKLPCGDAGNANYIGGGSFSLHGVSFNTEGQIGEKRKYNSVA